MHHSYFSHLVSLVLVLLFSFSGYGQKKELDKSAYQRWRRVDYDQLSANGKWVMYRYLFFDNDAGNNASRNTYFLYEVKTGKTVTLKDVDSPEFFAGGEWLSYMVMDSLNGEAVTYREALCLKNNRKMRLEGEPERNPDYPQIAYSTMDGVVVKNIETNDSIELKQIGEYRFYGKKWDVIYTREESGSRVICYGPTTRGKEHKVIYRDKTKSLNRFFFNEWDGTGTFQVVVDSTNKDVKDYYAFSLADGKVTKILAGREVAEMGMDMNSIRWVGKQKYLLYDLKQEPRKREVKGEKDESFKLELWSWNDPVIASQQAKSGFRELPVAPVKYIYDLKTREGRLLCDEDHPELYVPDLDDVAFAFEKDERPYRHCKDWQHDDRYDLYVVELATGKHQRVAEALTRSVSWSPNGDYILFFDNADLSWVLLEPQSLTRRKLTDEIPYALHDELYDRPNPAPAYGVAGWSRDGKSMIVYDRFDIWVVDLKGEKKTYCWTKEAGRKQNTVFRLVDPGQNGVTVDVEQDVEVASLNWTDKSGGLLKLTPRGKLTPKIVGDFALTILKESKDKTTVLCTKQSYQDDRDLWVSDRSFRSMRKITDVNPQKEEYKWGDVQQVEWVNGDGTSNQGLLYLPDDYDKTKSYPTIVSFYETHTPEMHIHPVPGFSQAMIDIPTYVSKGYIVFQPDVYVKVGTPGMSAYNVVISGTKALIERGIIDSTRVGLQGHSWSGFLVAYLVTRTDMFQCVNIGAATVDLPFVYTGIRGESGISNMLMYEDWQCRMGKTLWEDLQGYLENSPLLFADRIHTPTLIFHCDQDGAVPYEDGRSLFLALRRLERPVWLLNYMGEGHFLFSRPAQADWTLRMEQFFNHYLKNAPMPRWMKEGINVKERGYDQKYELVF